MSGTVQRVEVRTGSRLHLGMFSFKNPDRRSFGGAGIMLAGPGVRLSAETCDHLEASGPLAAQAMQAAGRVMDRLGMHEPPGLRLRVEQAAPHHVGLGTGTQLALAASAAVYRFFDQPLPAADELARLSGRGRRSAVGLHGFYHGGLIVEAGKFDPLQVGPMVARATLPAAWRFVLLRREGESALHGAGEQRAFESLPPVPDQTTDRLCAEAMLHLLPPAAEGDFAAFSAALYRFNRLAGQCFAAAQHGAYASPAVADWVQWLRRQGVSGVGQSSWGPTVFALVPDEAAAEDLCRAIGRRAPCGMQVTVAAVANQGAAILVR